jgi:hypothetical protein
MKPFIIQGVPKLVIQKSAVITSEIEVTILSGTFQNLRLVLKFLFISPDGIPLVQTCEATYYLNRRLVAWIGRGGTIAWPPSSSYLTHLDFSVWRYVQDKLFVPPLAATTGKDSRSGYDRRCGHDS